MKTLFIILVQFVFVLFSGTAQLHAQISDKKDKDQAAIFAVMQAQEKAWNEGNLVDFMAGYWKSESLKFIGKSGINYGWEKTLQNYQKGYPNQEAMGKLTFTIIELDKLSAKSAFMIGKWHLKRANDELSGHFTLLWKKINGKWLIVADHSS
jgi:ketosteroid isomerase-like protein